MKTKKKVSKSKVNKNPKGKEITWTLPFALTDEEKAERGLEAAEKNNEIAQLTIKKKIQTDEISAQIKDRTARRNVLLKQIHEGIEKREVQCVEVKNFDTNKIEYWFNGEKNSEREMSPEERQLEFEPAPTKKKKAKTVEAPVKTEMTAAERDIAESHAEETSAKKSWSMVNGARA